MNNNNNDDESIESLVPHNYESDGEGGMDSNNDSAIDDTVWTKKEILYNDLSLVIDPIDGRLFNTFKDEVKVIKERCTAEVRRTRLKVHLVDVGEAAHRCVLAAMYAVTVNLMVTCVLYVGILVPTR